MNGQANKQSSATFSNHRPVQASSFSYLQSAPIKGNKRLPSAVIISQEGKLAVYVESGGIGDGDRWDRYEAAARSDSMEVHWYYMDTIE